MFDIIVFLLDCGFIRNKMVKNNQYEYYITTDTKKICAIMIIFENYTIKIYEYKSNGHYSVYFTSLYANFDAIKTNTMKLIKKQQRLFKLKTILGE